MAHANAHAVKRRTGLMDWLTTVDHKKIGILYLIAGGFFFLVGGLEAILNSYSINGSTAEYSIVHRYL